MTSSILHHGQSQSSNASARRFGWKKAIHIMLNGTRIFQMEAPLPRHIFEIFVTFWVTLLGHGLASNDSRKAFAEKNTITLLPLLTSVQILFFASFCELRPLRLLRLSWAKRAASRTTRNSELGTRNPEPGTRNPEPGTRNSEPGTPKLCPASDRDGTPAEILPLAPWFGLTALRGCSPRRR